MLIIHLSDVKKYDVSDPFHYDMDPDPGIRFVE